MAKVFLDANIFIDIIEKRASIAIEDFREHILFISPLSIHILTYTYKYKIPDKKLDGLEKLYNLVAYDLPIVLNSLTGPTNDFEDNVQLHSAAQTDCDFFLTSDVKLLKLKFFGKVKIESGLSLDPNL